MFNLYELALIIEGLKLKELESEQESPRGIPKEDERYLAWVSEHNRIVMLLDKVVALREMKTGEQRRKDL